MIAQVKDNGGTKTLEQISGSIPTGNPVGTLLTTYKKIQPRNYLYCDGSTFNAGQYPALYLYLGTNVLPDFQQEPNYVYIKAVDGVDISDEDTFLVTVKNFVDERVIRAESYSTEEVWTGGYWYDGKKIYKKVVDCGALPNNTTKNVAHNIANISWIVTYSGMASDGNEWLQLPASYYSTSAVGLSVDRTNISLRPYSNRTTYTSTFVTIEYTKTTD